MCWSLASRSIQQLGNQNGGRKERTRICRDFEFGSPRSAVYFARIPRCSHSWHQETYSEITYHFKGTLEKKKILIKIIFASKLHCVYNRICQWYETENLVLTPRRDEEQIDLDPEQSTLITQKHRKMPQARGDSMLQLTENRETLIRRASEQAFAKTVESGQF